ncbi:SDR family oxidoreductase [Priestia megaterium]|uniref:SDR family oxidoreductase n=1 Tax=Priestia megaterium TaxID=1404 RepID=UPI00203CDFBC|nr:SDR family oxidoreductase [Priestia megaterium]MCM3186857.1 SDR family oxidoreductase [Priestia megaterium]
MIYNITAATGNLGRKIVEEALRIIKPSELVLTVRNPKKAKSFSSQGVNVKKADYNSIDEMVNAFEGTDVLIYIPSISFPSTVRIAEFEKSLQAAEKANVKHLIFVGFIADHENNPFKMSPFFGYASRRLASSNLSYTLVRNAMYADPLVPYLPELVERGRLLYPVGEGKISFVSREDIARAIIQLAIKPDLHGGRYTLTGEKAYSMPELAKVLSNVSHSTIKYDPMTVEEFASTYDEPKGFGEVLVSLYVAAERNLMDEVTDDYQLITGEKTEVLENYLMHNYKEK